MIVEFVQIRFQELAWIEAPMPDGSGPVQLAALPLLGDQEFRAFVKFPAGWSRPSTGYYLVDEEVFVLAGDLTFNACSWRAGSHAWIPALSVRCGLHSTNGALVLAWFSGPPRWKRGPSPTMTQDVMRSIECWEATPKAAMAGMEEAHVLRDSGKQRTWVTRATEMTFPFSVECLAIDERTWSLLEPNERGVASTATLWRTVERA